jgi:small subunit ribosomal protein S20
MSLYSVQEILVAHHKSAKKRIRQTETKTQLRKSQSSEMRSLLKKLRENISNKEKEAASVLLKKVQSLLSRLAKVGSLRKGNSSRRVSRLASQVNKL